MSKIWIQPEKMVLVTFRFNHRVEHHLYKSLEDAIRGEWDNHGLLIKERGDSISYEDIQPRIVEN